MNNSPKYWVACSGGVDSVVLLHLMKDAFGEVGILHCNFNLRGEDSIGDKEFVKALADELAIPIRIKEFDTYQYMKDKNLNLELAARELRYNWFDEIIQTEDKLVIIGHHLDDQIETFFLQLRRGGKVRGLSGMPVERIGYVRPLLKYTKQELIDLAKNNDWKWREDITNKSSEFIRNFYRNEVIPWFREQGFPINQVVPLMHDFQKLLHFLRSCTIPNEIAVSDWKLLPFWYKNHLLDVHCLSEYPVDEVDRLTESIKGKYLGNDIAQVWNEGEKLLFVKKKFEDEDYSIKKEEVDKSEVDFSHQDCIYLDADKVSEVLTIRKWQEGDSFQPFGMKGRKTVSKFLRDRKVLAHSKENHWVLLDGEEVVGVFGFGAGEKYKIEGENILKVQLIKPC